MFISLTCLMVLSQTVLLPGPLITTGFPSLAQASIREYVILFLYSNILCLIDVFNISW